MYIHLYLYVKARFGKPHTSTNIYTHTRIHTTLIVHRFNYCIQKANVYILYMFRYNDNMTSVLSNAIQKCVKFGKQLHIRNEVTAPILILTR